jgi:uncharacterized protein (TIGR02246 family)
MTGPGSFDVVDRLAIEDLYARYSHAYDAGDAEQVVALFTDDGEFMRAGAPPVRGRAALSEMVAASAARALRTRHLVMSVLITPERDGDTATGTAFVQVVRPGGDSIQVLALGRYEDLFVREGRRWLIRSRRFTAFAVTSIVPGD